MLKLMPEKYRRVILYVDDKDYTTLRSRLVLVHKTVSQWFREHVKEFIKKPAEEEVKADS